MNILNECRVKTLDWCVVAVLMLLSIGSAVLVAAGYGSETTVKAASVYYEMTSVLQTVILLWAVWCIYRMAKWQERKSAVFLVFFIALLLNGVCSPLVEHFVEDSNLQVGVTAAFGLLLFITGIVATVRLFHDGVKPLGTILVLYIVVPMIINISIPLLIKTGIALAYAITGVLSTALVALVFLFRNALGRMEEDEY